ncbi:universal stress protein [Amnibacterium kyonggiense]|uniref:Nucleotide-binding universal stress UspA family protein n=1 Tax=Amnibacterium kyonggiense TaxID=595671 RepID=A0A4R7FKF2_9MICO|nr:universal stress protein [Amnibacterium kyonggiense]TDS76833.1 nucleotide-binding universal stress UspA family protein [Amnibacterium kyonggiense]
MSDSNPSRPSDHRPRVVVGVDGSADSVAALRAGEWAAAARGGELVAVVAWGVPMIVPRAPIVIPDLREAAATLLQEALVDAFHGRCVVPVRTVIVQGGPADVLVEESRTADLLVVGSRGHGGFVGLLIGSVSMACAMHAHCPVLVMHGGDRAPDAESPSGGRVVVGVGGAASATAVLRAATEAAAEMDAELDAVAAWEDTTMYADAYVDFRSEVQDQAQRELDDAVAAAFRDDRPPRLHPSLREGPTARVLIEASADADLLVVGRAGHRELAGLLLGSVALPVAAHAKCPVLVVPAEPVPAKRTSGAKREAATV